MATTLSSIRANTSPEVNATTVDVTANVTANSFIIAGDGVFYSNGDPYSSGGGGTSYDANATSSGWFGLPTGNTLQRNVTAEPGNGSIRVNSTTEYLEVYYNGNWINVQNMAVASATGGSVTEVDGYKYHAFTTGGTFSVTSWPGGTLADIILV